MKKIKKGDKIIVIAGADKGTISSVVKVLGDKVRIDGVRVMKKAVKGKGFVEKHLPIHISNVSLYHEATKGPSRVSFVYEGGKKWRMYVKDGKRVGS